MSPGMTTVTQKSEGTMTRELKSSSKTTSQIIIEASKSTSRIWTNLRDK
jgi:hypothetical protein